MRLLLLGLLLLGRSCCAEWVEIPQFSDQQKVYRSPLTVPVHQTQLVSDRRIYKGAKPTATEEHHLVPHKITFHDEASLRNVSGFAEHLRPIMFTTEASFMGTISTFTTNNILNEENPENTEINPNEGIEVESHQDRPPDFEELQVEDENDSYEGIVVTSESIESTTIPMHLTSSDTPQCLNETENNKGFLDYLPIELFKRVHKTLKAQPATLKGKYRFLKAFETTFVQEIESRLTAALAPSRIARGARDHDDHDDGIGFPSLEGTLMAISFLTFAVYLVRLVMMLFRNAGNGGTTPIFIGRKRRSTDDFDEETARILSYLDSSLLYQF